MPLSGPEPVAEVTEPMVPLFSGGGYPYLFELATEHVLKPGYDFGDEFDFGLDAIFDALARAVPDSSGPGRGRESSEVLK